MDDVLHVSVSGIVLAGGRSSRMGMAKAWVPFGAETLLQRVVRTLGEVARPVVVASREGLQLPELPSWTHVVYDRHNDCGPMEGLATALEWLQGRAEMAFVSSCDVPLLQPVFVRRMIALIEEFDIAVPYVQGFYQPFAAVYRTRLLTPIRESLAMGQRRIVVLYDRVPTRRVTEEELKSFDPQLHSILNVNDPEACAAALRWARSNEATDGSAQGPSQDTGVA